MELQKVIRKFAGAGVLLASIGIVKDSFLYDVDAGTRAVIFDKLTGISDKVIGEGTHFIIPFLQVPIIMDIRSRPRMIISSTGTKDLQNVKIQLRVLSHPDEKELPTIYRTLGLDFDDRILPSIGNEVLKAVVAQYNAEELLSKREYVSKAINHALVDRAAKFNILLDDVSITHLQFGAEFARAIEHKQVAQQEAETQAYVVMKADQERKAAIIRAEGEAEAAELISNAMSTAGTGLVEVRRIDTAKEVAATLARSGNVIYLPSSNDGSNLLLNLNGR